MGKYKADLQYEDAKEVKRLLEKGKVLAYNSNDEFVITGGALIRRHALRIGTAVEREAHSLAVSGFKTHFIYPRSTEVGREDTAYDIYLREIIKSAENSKKSWVLFYGVAMPENEFLTRQKNLNIGHWSYKAVPIGKTVEIIENPMWFEDDDHIKLRRP